MDLKALFKSKAVVVSFDQQQTPGAINRLVGDASLQHQQWRWGLTKMLRVMKLTAIIVLAACLHVSANGYSQQITLTEKNVPLSQVFKEIQRQSGYDFFYTYELVEQIGNISVNVSNVSLQQALEECLKGLPLTYSIENKTVVIQRAQDRVSLQVKNGTLETVLKEINRQTGYLYAFQDQWKDMAQKIDISVTNAPLDEVLAICFKDQPFTYAIIKKTIVIKEKGKTEMQPADAAGPGKTVDVQGTVYNDAGQPLSGANVTIKETQKGTITDARGEFDLPSVPVNSTLIISFIGYAPEQRKITDVATIKIYLKVTKNELDKVVIQAYGTTSQRLTTGNIGTVTSAEIEKQPVMNPLEALQGRVAGVVVTSTNGYASSPIKVEIRGRNSINPNFTSDPLYIIDGVPLTVLEVSGNASYAGGSTGFDQTGLANSIGLRGQSPFFSINPSDIESITVLKDADATSIYGSRAANGVILITTKKGKGGKTKFDINAYEGESAVTKHWQMLNTHQYLAMRREALKNDGLTPTIANAPDLLVWDTTQYTDWQKYLWGNLGKTTDIQTSLSGGDARTTFRMGADYHRQTSILTVSGADQRIAISSNITHKGLNQRFTVSFTNMYSYSQTNIVGISGDVTIPPDAPAVFDNKGRLNYAGWAPLQSSYPFGGLEQPYTSKTNFLNSNIIFDYQVLKGLGVKASIGYNNAQANQTLLTPIASQNPQFNPTGSSRFGYNNSHNWIIEPQVEYNRFINRGKFNVLFGGSSSYATTDGYLAGGSGYTYDALLRSISNAPSVFSHDNFAQFKYAAVFSRINYNWDDKYILNLSARRDGSSRFAPGSQFGNFASVGAAWIFSEENWIKHKLPILSFGKLRGSYGITGMDGIGDYAYLSRWTSGIQYNGITGLYPTQHVDSNYHWQVNHKLELAIDLGFLHDRVSIEVAFYRNRCNNQLIPTFPIPQFTGFGTITANSPANVENEGWEFLINARLIDIKNFKWSINLNVGINRNKLLGYPNFSLSPYAAILTIGKPLNIAKLLHYTGVDVGTGQYSYQDKNHDGQITVDYTGKPDDRYDYDLSPKFSGGLNNIFSYKNWELSAFFYFIRQIGLNAITNGQAGNIRNQPIDVLQRWQKPGDISSIARFTTQGALSDTYFGVSDGVYTDASFIRLKTLSLSYTLPEAIAKNSGMQSLKTFIRAENLFVITKYKGLDPETQNFGGMPPSKVITGGISINF